MVTDFVGTTFSLKFNSTAYVRQVLILAYRKIPKISPGTYFSKALFEGLIFGGAYLRRESCVSKSIGLVL